MKELKVFITGATGLLGGSIVTELLNKGFEVTALVRSLERAGKILDPKVDLIEGSLEAVDGFANKLGEFDVLIHAAAVYGEYYRNGKEKVLFDINVNGTIALFDEARKAGLNNIVYVSSSAVLDTDNDTELDEKTPYSNTTEPYFRSKVLAEQAVFKFLEEYPAMRIVTLLPTVMLGPGDRGPTPTGNFILNCLKGKFKAVIPGSNRIVDVRDVAAAAVQATTSGKSGERYIIGGRSYPYSEIFKTLWEISGNPPLTKTMSPGKLLFIARLVTFIHKIKGKPSPLKPAIIKRLQKNFWYNSSKAEKELGASFRPLKETLSDTVSWFKENGYG
ncbi:MAG: NAD-dependent epimerase/dehydratase family protein [bacterium]|nr:NAD-dependent epimerase/dehydratase family protein [bacterium]